MSMPPRPWPAHVMALAAAGAVVLTLAHPSSTRQYTWPWILLLHAVWLAPLAVLAHGLVSRTDWRWPRTGLLSGLLLLAAGTLLSAAASPYAAASLPRAWPALAGVAACLWLHDWLGEPAHSAARRRRLGRGLAALGALLSVASLAGWLARPGDFSWAVRNDFPFGHSIQLAGALLLLLPWLVAAAWTGMGAARVAWAAAAALGGLMLLVTSSRSAVLAAGLVVAAGTAWALFRTGWSRRTKAGLVLAAVALFAVAVLANPRLRELALRGAWSDVARESNTQRTAMLEAGWLMGADRPLTGWGPGTVPLVYPQIRHRLDGGVDNVLQLHNTPAQLWATLGLPGAAALVLLLAASARRLFGLWRDPGPEAPALASAASLAGYGLFALTDHQLDLPAMHALLVVNAALLLAADAQTRPTPRPRLARLAAGGALALVALSPFAPTVRDLAGRYRYDQALTLLAGGRLDGARARLESATRFAPHDPYYRHQLATLLLQQRGATADETARARLVEEAYAQLAHSLQTGAFTEYAHFNLGWLALERGDPRLAAAHFRDALREAPHRRGAYFGLGLALRALDPAHEAHAVRAFALEWLNEPSACTAPLWEWPDFAPLRPQVEAEALRLLAEISPAPPAAAYLRAFWPWWSQGGTPPTTGWNAETTAFIRRLSAPAAEVPAYAWDRLLSAWQSPDPAAAFAALRPRQPGFTAALARRAARHPPPDLRGFLTAGLENEAALLLNETPARTGYGVLALHPDGPVLTDLYLRQQNRVVSEFASPLFPPKGWIPAADLLARLPPAP